MPLDEMSEDRLDGHILDWSSTVTELTKCWTFPLKPVLFKNNFRFIEDQFSEKSNQTKVTQRKTDWVKLKRSENVLTTVK